MSGNATFNDPGYPSLQGICNLWRALANDPKGEVIQTPVVDATGAIILQSSSALVDPAPNEFITGEQTIVAPILNSAIREVYREMRNISSQTLIKDNIIFLSLPVIQSPSSGFGVADPTVQVQLSPVGFYNGTQYNAQFLLPGDCLTITDVWERISGSNDDFHKLHQAKNGLSGVAQSAFSLGSWEMRGDALWMNGSLQNMDLRIRYLAKFPTFFTLSVDYTQTFIPIPDCEEAVALKCIYKYNTMQGSGTPESMQLLEQSKQDAKDAVFELRQQQVRRMQGNEYSREPYGGGDWTNMGQ